MWLLYYFNFKRNYEILKSKSPSILLSKNINFDKNEPELKMKNPAHSFGEMLCASAHIKSQIKAKTVMSWSSRKKKEDISCTVYFVQRKLF